MSSITGTVSFTDSTLYSESIGCSRYLDDLLNNDNPYFDGMVKQIDLPELHLNKAIITVSLLEMDLFLLKFMINAMTLILI